VTDETIDRTAVAAVRATWTAAVAAGDVTRLADLLEEDYEVWAHGAAPLRGRDAATAAMGAALASYAIEQTFEPEETVVAGAWAFERGLDRMHLTPRDGGPPRELVQRALLILHRGADGRWRYARGMTNGLPALAARGDE
jgi:uncharacterized protein (TIGR02246 family)